MTLKTVLISLATLITFSTAYGQDHNIIGHYYSSIKADKNSVTFHIAENLKHSNNLKDCQSTLKKITDSLEEIAFDTEKQNLFQVTYSSYINKDSSTAILNTCEITVKSDIAKFKKIESQNYEPESVYDHLPENDPRTKALVFMLRSRSGENTINLFQTKHAGFFGFDLRIDYVQVIVD